MVQGEKIEKNIIWGQVKKRREQNRREKKRREGEDEYDEGTEKKLQGEDNGRLEI
jgi:hypothetical protein